MRTSPIPKRNLKRRNHYLAACHQRAFSTKTGQVWVKESGSTAELRSPDTVGIKKSLYIVSRGGQETDKLEDYLGKEIDDPFAKLSQRVKQEKNGFRTLEGAELKALCMFVAFQAVRTLGHKSCVEEQAQRAVDSETFIRVMGNMAQRILIDWSTNLPNIHFYTPLPDISARFITGDHPVVVIVENFEPIWQPTAEPKLGIKSITDILANPNHAFQMAVSPYVCVVIKDRGGKVHLPPQQVDPSFVRSHNRCVSGQSQLFVLGKDPEDLT